MNYILKPSLEHITLVKVAATLWNPHIRELTAEFHNSFYDLIFPDTEIVVLGKVRKLPLPKLLKQKTLGLIRPIGLRILNWIKYHCGKLCFNISVPEEFYWLPRGTIDEKKMAEMLIKDEGIDILTRYKLACIYCLEKSIRELWIKIPENCRLSLRSEDEQLEMPEGRRMPLTNENDPTCVMQHDLVVLWTHEINGQMPKMRNLFGIKSNHRCSPYQYAFECAASAGNEVAAEYFLHKLNSKEREDSLLRTACSVATKHSECRTDNEQCLKDCYSDILCTLLSQMDNEQQVEVLKIISKHVLNCFLNWPNQTFFLEIADRTWSFLSEKDYKDLFVQIIHRLAWGNKDFNYKKLLEGMWQQSPNNFKNYVLDPDDIFYILSVLFIAVKDKDNIKLIFQDMSSIKKNQIISSDSGRWVCQSLIAGKDWDLLEFFIQECLSSKDEVLKFKGDFKSNLHYVFFRDHCEKRTEIYDTFFRLLDDFICSFSKRRCVEDDKCEVKKFCNKF